VFQDTIAPIMGAVSPEVIPVNEPTPDHPHSIEALQAEFIALLPKIEYTVQVRLRHIACSDRRADLICEAIALCWKWYIGLSRKERSPAEFLYTFAALAARAALSGRRLCGCEKTRDALSPLCQRKQKFVVSPLPDTSGLIGNMFDEALIDNTQTPVPDQVQFRLDFPRWRASLGERSRILMDAMVEGHRTNELAAVFNVTQARISQVRRELRDGWLTICGDDDPSETQQGEPAAGRTRRPV